MITFFLPRGEKDSVNLLATFPGFFDERRGICESSSRENHFYSLIFWCNYFLKASNDQNLEYSQLGYNLLLRKKERGL